MVANNPHKVNVVGSNPTPAIQGPLVEWFNTADSKSAEPGFESQPGLLDNDMLISQGMSSYRSFILRSLKTER